MKQCLQCGLFFIPEEEGQARCGRCKQTHQDFPPKPIDLWEHWAK